MKDPDLSYINENGKKVSGSAAFLHHVYTEEGGVVQYNEKVGLIYSDEERRLIINERTNNRIEKEAKKSRFKVI